MGRKYYNVLRKVNKRNRINTAKRGNNNNNNNNNKNNIIKCDRVKLL